MGGRKTRLVVTCANLLLLHQKLGLDDPNLEDCDIPVHNSSHESLTEYTNHDTIEYKKKDFIFNTFKEAYMNGENTLEEIRNFYKLAGYTQGQIEYRLKKFEKLKEA